MAFCYDFLNKTLNFIWQSELASKLQQRSGPKRSDSPKGVTSRDAMENGLRVRLLFYDPFCFMNFFEKVLTSDKNVSFYWWDRNLIVQ